MPKRFSYYDDYYFKPSRPYQTEAGVKARSQRGAFAKNWWATQWIRAMERLVDSGRLSRGRSYARQGQVISIDEKKGGVVQALVQGSRKAPYKVRIEVAALSDLQWELVIDHLAEQAIFTAQLLSGEMPVDIEEAFQAAGVSLFPSRSGDLSTSCSCPDWANPCKHVAATHYILGERFDEDPFFLFRLRGRTQDELLKALRLRRSAGMDTGEEREAEEVVPLEADASTFWTGKAGWGSALPIQPPAIEMPLLKRLGEASFLPGESTTALLGKAYAAISQAALVAAYEERESGQPE